MEEQIQIVELGEKSIKKIAKEVHKLNKAEKRKLKDNVYHNTKLLLTNYHKLKSHCEIVKEEITTNLDTTWKEDRFALNSLLENKIKTTKLMDHVDKSLEKFKDSEIEEYRLIRRKYFSNVKSDDMTISVEYDVDRRTISRRIDKAVEDLSIILFGMDVLF